MNLHRTIMDFAVPTIALLVLAANTADAAVTYTTNVGTAFSGGGAILAQPAGVGVTLTFALNGTSVTGKPSSVEPPVFTLLYPACTTQTAPSGQGTFFDSLSINLNVNSVPDGNAERTFLETSSGGTACSGLSGITIPWAPLVIGPDPTNATSGNFGSTIFSTTVFTRIPAPNFGGRLPGVVSTVEGFVTTTGVSERATIGLVFAALLALGAVRRKHPSRK